MSAETQEVNKNGVKFLQFKKLLKYEDRMTHGYTMEIEKNYKNPNDKETELKNYEELCKAMEIDINKLVRPIQQHTKNIKTVDEIPEKAQLWDEKYEQTDGLVTNKKIVLASTSADCISLLLYDPNKNVIANSHSGWRGTLQRVAVETVEKMKAEYGSNPEDLICCLCPSILKCHFEVGEDVKDMFEKEFQKEIDELSEFESENKTEQIKEIITKRNNVWAIDTVALNKIMLRECGLKYENILDSGICTVCSKDIYHTYRGEGENYGLNTAIIALR